MEQDSGFSSNYCDVNPRAQF